MLFTEDDVYEAAFSKSIAGGRRSPPCCSAFTIPEAAISGSLSIRSADGVIGYARFRFSYISRLPESMGQPVLFEGISCFRFRGTLIARCGEGFDRGVALAQLDFPAERIKRIVQKAAAAQNQLPEARRHLERFSQG